MIKCRFGFILGWLLIIFITGCSNLDMTKAYKMAAISMEPSIHKGDRAFVNKAAYVVAKPQRGEIVAFKYPIDPQKIWIKRVIAFGGETVEIRNGKIYINGKALTQGKIKSIAYSNAGEFGTKGKTITIPEDHYYLLGDNSENSLDSRYWGFVPKENIVGKVYLIYWPLNRFGKIE